MEQSQLLISSKSLQLAPLERLHETILDIINYDCEVHHPHISRHPTEVHTEYSLCNICMYIYIYKYMYTYVCTYNVCIYNVIYIYILSIFNYLQIYVYLPGNSKKLPHRKATFSSPRQKPRKPPQSHCVAALCASWKPALREQFGDVGHLGSRI